MRNATINYHGDSRYLDPVWIKLAAETVVEHYWKLSLEAPSDFVVDINVVSSSKIRTLNKEYLHKDSETDVIAFSFFEGLSSNSAADNIIGQIVISRDAAKQQAKFYGHNVRDEMQLLLVHGLLHVSGWDEGVEIKECQIDIIKALQT